MHINLNKNSNLVNMTIEHAGNCVHLPDISGQQIERERVITSFLRRSILWACVAGAAYAGLSHAEQNNTNTNEEHNMKPPGVIIDESPDPKRIFIGSPSIAVLPNGAYVASHDFFGPGTEYNTTAVLQSTDRGESWDKLCALKGQFFSVLFVLEDTLYMLGTDGHWGSIIVRKSNDGGKTWTTPRDHDTGIIMASDERFLYATAPGALLVHGGRVWKEVARRRPGPRRFAKEPLDFLVLSAPVNANLLNAASWELSTPIHDNPKPPEPCLSCCEGNIVVGPDGNLYDILRVHEPEKGGMAALLTLSADGKTLSFDPASGFIKFPGGCKKFTIRRDPQSGLYWSLTNWEQDKDRPRAKDANYHRNTLSLTASKNLRDWEVRAIILYHPDVRRVGFQYADWQFEGDDIVAVVRTAFGDAPNCHDANYLTFHRIKDFRNRKMADKPLD